MQNPKKAGCVIFTLACCTSVAQAQSTVSVYGITNVSIDRLSTRIGGTSVSTLKLNSNSSRLGFRGAEDFGDGLSAIYQIEGKVAVDVGTGGVNSRETFVGLRSNSGTIKLGLMDPPIDDVKTIFGNVSTGVTSILNTSALWINSASDYLVSDPKVNNGFLSMNETLPNSVRYNSPKFGNFTTAIQYSHPTPAENIGDGHNIGMNLVYNDGVLKAAIANYQNVSVRGHGLNDQSIVLTAGRTLGRIYLAGVYTRQTADWSQGTIHRNFWGVSSTYTTGPHGLYVFYSKVGNGSLAVPTATKTGAQMAEISYNYNLSKNSTLYTGYVRIENEANATYQIGTNRLAGGDIGASPAGFIVGLKHNF